MGSMKAISENIRVLRQIKRISQKSLAEKANVSQSTIAQVECGGKNVSIDTLDKVAKALKIPPGALFEPRAWELI